MRYDPERHHRRSIRLRGYDYSQPGTYFVTICTQERMCLFGEVVDGKMRLNDAGRMVERIWGELPNQDPCVELDAFVVMPNHIHGIIVITTSPVGAGLAPALVPAYSSGATTRVAPTLGGIVGAFKSRTTVEYIWGIKTHAWQPFTKRLWQRNYYEHIIRNEESLNRIRQYIANNPLRWHLDRENPNAVGTDTDWEQWLKNHSGDKLQRSRREAHL